MEVPSGFSVLIAVAIFLLSALIAGLRPDGLLERTVPLLDAAKTGNYPILKSLLPECEEINARDERGRTALHYAVERGELEMTRLLLKHGADPKLKDIDDDSPLDLRTEQSPEVAALLEERGEMT